MMDLFIEHHDVTFSSPPTWCIRWTYKCNKLLSRPSTTIRNLHLESNHDIPLVWCAVVPLAGQH
jgi:hypothetical protein